MFLLCYFSFAFFSLGFPPSLIVGKMDKNNDFSGVFLVRYIVMSVHLFFKCKISYIFLVKRAQCTPAFQGVKKRDILPVIVYIVQYRNVVYSTYLYF